MLGVPGLHAVPVEVDGLLYQQECRDEHQQKSLEHEGKREDAFVAVASGPRVQIPSPKEAVEHWLPGCDHGEECRADDRRVMEPVQPHAVRDPEQLLRREHGDHQQREQDREVVENAPQDDRGQPDVVKPAFRREPSRAASEMLDRRPFGLAAVEPERKPIVAGRRRPAVGRYSRRVEQAAHRRADQASARDGREVVDAGQQPGRRQLLQHAQREGSGPDATPGQRQSHEVVPCRRPEVVASWRRPPRQVGAQLLGTLPAPPNDLELCRETPCSETDCPPSGWQRHLSHAWSGLR